MNKHNSLNLRLLLVSFAMCMIFLQGCATTGSRSVELLTIDYIAKTPHAKSRRLLSLKKAYKAQELFVNSLTPELGTPVGYKVGLTNRRAQQYFNVKEPVRGVLLDWMLMESGATLPYHFGARPMAEGDLLVRVADEAINNATTPMEALRHIDAVIPFMELPDLVYSKDVRLSAPLIIAANVGARYGVTGRAIRVYPTKKWLRRFKNITVELFDEEGRLLSSGNSSSLMEDPMQVVLWIKNSLKAEGKSLKTGDLISLGSITALVPVTSGMQTISARYTGLEPLRPNSTIEITIRFTE
jgi:2-keto-4-pentenoate hydratase